jgi:acyl-CoA synthetase (AMP-forming)/AMP-acid ligase II
MQENNARMLEYYDAVATLADIPDLHAARRPERTALIFDDRRTSYGELAAWSDQVANGLIALGLEPGARVALLGYDSEKSYELLFGCAKAGLVMVTINWRLEAGEVAYIVQDSDADVMFVSPEQVATVESLLPACSRLKTVIVLSGPPGPHIAYDEWRDGQATGRPALDIDPAQPVVQVYTSGTSGRPKGVVVAHRCFLDLVREVVRAGDELVDWKDGDVSLVALPTFHIGGLWWGVHGLLNGVQNIILRTFNPALALECIQKYRTTKLAFVPAMIRFMLSEPASQETDFSSVEVVLYGGSPMPRPILEKAVALFKCRFVQNYGLSETANMAIYMSWTEHRDMSNPKLKAAGKPLRGVSVRIVDDDGRDLPPGQPGQIVFKTPSAMLEYWKLPQETAKTLVDGWLYTGDAGYLDEDGFVYVTDRIKDVIISAGENIYPAEIERVLAEHPDIDDVAVVAAPDDRWGEVPIAYIVKRPGAALTKGDVLGYARKNIAAFKMPRTVEFIDKLPRNPGGKILKRVLREPHWAGREKRVN